MLGSRDRHAEYFAGDDAGHAACDRRFGNPADAGFYAGGQFDTNAADDLEALDAVRAAGVKADQDRRTVIVHSQCMRPDQFDAYVELGLSPSFFQPSRVNIFS